MRPSAVFLTLGVLGCAACSHATGPTRQAAAPSPARQDTSRATNGAGQTAGRQQAPDASAPKPYNQVITAGATTDSGVLPFTVWVKSCSTRFPRPCSGASSCSSPISAARFAACAQPG